MLYSDIIGIDSFFDSTFNMTEERENYWKQFITNEKFESNLKEIIKVFTSTNIDQHKSVWIQGTYGTGKSHSTSVIKHLLGDDYDDISEYVKKLSDSQLKAMLLEFRKKERIFPVVLKGTYSIVDTEDLKYTIQRAVMKQLETRGINITVKSDFQAVIEMIDDEKYDSFWDTLIRNELKQYADSKNELKKLLENGDVDVLKGVSISMKKDGIIKATPDIRQWLTEVIDELRNNRIADYLVIFWDEFTSLLEISERRSILNCMQDIAELSKAPRKGDKEKCIGVYVFLITHKNMESTSSYKELKDDEKSMAKARFLRLQYDMNFITTYHILSNALKIKKKPEYERLVENRIRLQTEVSEALNGIVENMDRSAQMRKIIERLFPFHPYTAYLATFVSRAVGSSERSIFEFLNDENKGFKAFINNDVEKEKYLTADKVWDFFVGVFSEDRINNFDSVINKYSMYSSSLKDTDIPELSVFKVILLLNLLNRVTQLDDGNSEKNLVNPSKKNIINALSGAWGSDVIESALDSIDRKQIIIKGPDDVFEVSSSAMSTEKIRAEKNKLYLKYKDVVSIMNEFPAFESDLKKVISNCEVLNRAKDFVILYGGNNSVSIESKLLKAFEKKYAIKIALFLFRGETPEFDKNMDCSEISIENQKNMLQELSKKEQVKDIIFIVLDTTLGQRRYEGIVDELAKREVAKETKIEDPEPHRKKAEKWVESWKNDLIEGSATVFFRGERVNTSNYKTVCNAGVIKNAAKVFKYGIEKNDRIATANTSWKETYARKTVEKVIFATSRDDISKLNGVEAAISYLLKDRNGDWLYDEKLNYVGKYDELCPITVLTKEVDDKIAYLRKETVVDIGKDFRFIFEAPFGYYKNPICMATVALVFRKYINKMYLADQGSLVTPQMMRDIINAAFAYWHENKTDQKLRVRFSTAEEKELVDIIHQIFGVEGDGISETKWNVREKFKEDYQAPLWAIKYLVDKGDEFNKVIDDLFSMANSMEDKITQEKISELLIGLKKQQTSIALTLKEAKNYSCLIPYVEKCLKEVDKSIDDYSNLLAFIKQNLGDEIVFWNEKNVESQIFQWCALQGKTENKESNIGKEEKVSNVNNIDYEEENDKGKSESVVEDNDTIYAINDSNNVESENLTVFEPIEFTPIIMNKSHVTVESTTTLIEDKELDVVQAKNILKELCKEYPVICSAVMKLLSED